MKYIASVKGQEFTIEIDLDRQITIDGKPYEVDFRRLPDSGIASLLLDNRSVAAVIESQDDAWDVLIQGELYSVMVEDERARRLKQKHGGDFAAEGEAAIASPMPGIIVDIPVSEGDPVAQGDKIIVLESMKMENELRSPIDGRVAQVLVSPGQSVEKKQVLVRIGPNEA